MSVTMEAAAFGDPWTDATHVAEFEVHFPGGTWETSEIPLTPHTPDDLQGIRAQVTGLIEQSWGQFYDEPWEIKRMYVWTREQYDDLLGALSRPSDGIIRRA